ncbi:MAG: hypothetical protein KDB65_00460 [Calditrichaeota bacterium]|nr:hypothetical protein [Calditrichota bacterium]MCB9368500.1 hypothetical protein [Calditrichota bacterium]
MGLHLHTKQSHGEAEITVSGNMSGTALAQLQAAIEHFQSRGCKVIQLNVDWESVEALQTPASRPFVLAHKELEIAIR